MRLRYKISIPLGALLVVVIALVGYTHTIAYKKGELHSLAKSFQQLLLERPELARSLHYPPGNEYEKEYYRITRELVSLTYSDIELFREMVDILRELRQEKSRVFDSVELVLGSLAAHGSIYENCDHPDREMLEQLIDMLEKTKLGLEGFPERDFISTAIASHAVDAPPPNEKPLTPGMVDRILKFLKENEDKPIPGDTRYNENFLNYFGQLVGALARWYSDYPPVYEYVLGIIKDRERYADSPVRSTALQALMERSTLDSEFVDMVIGILLDTTGYFGLRRVATDLDWEKIDALEKRRHFEALCKAVLNDPHEWVKTDAIGRIGRFDDPEAKAFIEKCAVDILQDKNKTVDEKWGLLWQLSEREFLIEKSKLVDTVIEILLDRTTASELRVMAASLIKVSGKVDTPNKRKYLKALCEAAETDPEEDVRNAAIRRIELFDDPDAKAFLEKLKSKSEK